MGAIYRDDLAHIQHVGFSDMARSAAPGLLADLRAGGIHNGLVVDLGCGDGIWLRTLRDAGYAAVGIDSSSALIDLARATVPEATLHLASVHEFEFPSCDAVTAIGEVLSYLPGDVQPEPSLARLFQRISRALRPGGLFIFDLMVTSPGAAMAYRTWRAGEDWAVLTEVAEDKARRLLARNITTFRRVGEHYRRACERQMLRVHTPSDVERELRASGFSVRRAHRYGEFPLLLRRLAFRARKLKRS